MEDAKLITAALGEPFEPAEVKFKPQSVKNNRALAMPYIDARVVQDRLDEVLGVENWQDEYTVLADGSVVCRLQIRVGGAWIAKTDVGSPSEQPDGGDRLKAAFSDALKRAAVKFGVGRYLYRLKSQWVDYDPVRRQFAAAPQLPAFALPQRPRPAGRGPAAGSAPPPLAATLRQGIEAADTLALLKAAWDLVNQNAEKLSRADHRSLADAKDRRKAELASKPSATPREPGDDSAEIEAVAQTA